MGARFYDSALARWLSADTLVPSPANPQSFNRFSYVAGNPLKYRDPSGHMEIYGGFYEPYGDGWYVRMNPEAPECQHNLEFIDQGASLAVDFTPGLGDAKGFAEVFTGKDLFTGESLGAWRWAGLIGLSELRHLRHADEAIDAARFFVRSIKGLEWFKTAGREVIPDVLKAFGGAVDYGAPVVPDALKGRNVRTIGSLGDTTAAAIERGARILDGPWSLDRNYDWIAEGIENGDVFELVTGVGEGVLLSEKYGISVFARELDMLLQAGYRRVGDFLVPPTP